MADEVEAARAQPADGEAARAERELRERTERLRAARLARDELKRHGAAIRADRRRGR